MSTALVIVAAGTGSRLGASVRKALVKLGGRPLVEHTLRRLLPVETLDPIVVVGHPEDHAALADMIAKLERPVRLVDGGARRQDSVRAGLSALAPPTPDSIVLVHDAARPFVPVDTLGALVSAARSSGCALLAIPVADTLKQEDDATPGLVLRTVPRRGLWAAQTPQAFNHAELLDRLDRADREQHTVTDESGLFEADGMVALVTGSPTNFKITTMQDLRLAQAWLDHAPP